MEIIEQAENLKRIKGRIDVIELANNYNVNVFSTTDMDVPSLIAFDKDSNAYEIYVNSKESRERQRFSIAHELAHFIKHKEKIQEFGVVGRQNIHSLSAREENEADSLAAEILMPESSVRDFMVLNGIVTECKIGDDIVKKFVKAFDVSLPAGAIRLRDLGYYARYI